MIPEDLKNWKIQIITEINKIIEENKLKIYKVYFFGSFSSKYKKNWDPQKSDIDIYFKFPKYFSDITIARDRTSTILVEFQDIEQIILNELKERFPKTKFHIFAGFDFNFIISGRNKIKKECELIYSLNLFRYINRKFN
jgi:predicted nucleotidyltransferase